MKNFWILAILIAGLCTSCNTEKSSDFTLTGTVKNLKKGTLFLQKFQDSAYVTLDSVALNGTSSFHLHSDLSEPEVLFLRLDKNDTDEGVIPFFADKGITEINTTLKHFNFEAEITGSKQQKVLDDYLKIMGKLNNQNLDLLKQKFDNFKDGDSTNISINDYQKTLLRRKYSYTINFALNNSDSEVAPYLALYEVPNTSVRYLDSIYNKLDDPIKHSLYGKGLKSFIGKRKAE